VKKIVPILILLTALVIGCVSEKGTQPEAILKQTTSYVKSHYSVYTNRIFDFQVEYPSDWSYMEGATYYNDKQEESTSIVTFYKGNYFTNEYEAVGIFHNQIPSRDLRYYGVMDVKDLIDVIKDLTPYAVGSSGKIKKTYVKRIGDKEVGVMELAVASGGKIGLKRVYIWWDEKNDSLWMFSAETNKRLGFEYTKEIEHIVASFRYI
jgi:hypothetical protein